MSPSTTNSKSTSKGMKKSKIIKLRLSPKLLSQFPSDVKPASPVLVKPEPSPSVQPSDHADKSSESNSTPLASNGNEDTDAASLAPPKAGSRRNRGGSTVSGRKRAPPSINPNSAPRERARPGPKKKPRLPDGTIDHSTDSKKETTTERNPVASHKLGPKANTGAINAGLRALDRSGKPCRRWERNTLQLKSFTGAMWAMPSWNAPQRTSEFSGDVNSDTTNSSDINQMRSSALPSEQSNMDIDGADHTMTNGFESSPAPPIAA